MCAGAEGPMQVLRQVSRLQREGLEPFHCFPRVSTKKMQRRCLLRC